MWRRLKNIFYCFRTYADLSPDVQIRRRVNQFLHNRSPLSTEEWFEQFWQGRKVSRRVSDFVYDHMQHYSGLEFARVRPNDFLNEDLHLPLICWFDWQLSLCEDFLQCFGIDLSDRFHPESLGTVEELVVFLNCQLFLNPANQS
jgi:hypothetical protein